MAVNLHGFKLEAASRSVGGSEPFFPTLSGWRTSPAILQTFHVEDAELFGETAQFGGHSLRRSGAQYWWAAGLPEALIRRLARWRSEAIEAYLQSAPLLALGPNSTKGWQPTDTTVPFECIKILVEMRKLLGTYLDEAKASQLARRIEQRHVNGSLVIS